jgi:hypothetical protein
MVQWALTGKDARSTLIYPLGPRSHNSSLLAKSQRIIAARLPRKTEETSFQPSSWLLKDRIPAAGGELGHSSGRPNMAMLKPKAAPQNAMAVRREVRPWQRWVAIFWRRSIL